MEKNVGKISGSKVRLNSESIWFRYLLRAETKKPFLDFEKSIDICGVSRS
jgi:hypothetical protein